MIYKWNNYYNDNKKIIVIDENYIKSLIKKIRGKKKTSFNFDRFSKSIGTMGGGNHFIEINRSDKNGDYYLIVHCGSRQFGEKICQFHQNVAIKNMKNPKKYKKEKEWILKNVDINNINTELNNLKEKYSDYFKQPKELAFLEEKEAFDYIIDMVIASVYARWNRKIILDSICEYHGWGKNYDDIETVHNYIDFDDFIIRKGAIRSYVGEYSLLPFNNEYGILLIEGKSNQEWNYSAPHGAGRIGPRSNFKNKKFTKNAMERMKKKGIFTKFVPSDETSESYKNPEEILKYIIDTCDIKDILRPVLNIKGSG
jgi:RNA-splicing ligase RtcB